MSSSLKSRSRSKSTSKSNLTSLTSRLSATNNNNNNHEKRVGHRRKKKNLTGNDDGQSGKRRKKKSTSEANKRKKKTTDDVDDVVAVPVSRRTTRGNPIYDTSESQTGNIPKALASHLTAGPGEKQWDRLINPGFCNIKECEVSTAWKNMASRRS